MTSPFLYIKELTRLNTIEIDVLIEKANSEFDFIILDIGTIRDLSSQLSDRRADSLVVTWASDHADDLWIIARPDRIGHERFKKIASILNRTSILSSITFVLNMRSNGRTGQEEERAFLIAASTNKAQKHFVLPSDTRNTADSSHSRGALAEVNERGILRKALAAIASEMIS
jgi:hypothetical protein